MLFAFGAGGGVLLAGLLTLVLLMLRRRSVERGRAFADAARAERRRVFRIDNPMRRGGGGKKLPPPPPPPSGIPPKGAFRSYHELHGKKRG